MRIIIIQGALEFKSIGLNHAVMKPLVEREAVRLVVLDANESILLLHTRDLSAENFGTAWELPGGGMDRAANRSSARRQGVRQRCTGPGSGISFQPAIDERTGCKQHGSCQHGMREKSHLPRVYA